MNNEGHEKLFSVKFTKGLLVLLTGVMALSIVPLFAVQELKEIALVSYILKQNTDACSKVLKDAHAMRAQAVPFLKPHYQERVRFHPNDEQTRHIMSLAREIRSRFKLLSGILYHIPIKNRDVMFKTTEASLDTLSNSSKRALRAIRDGNFQLYLASADTAAKEAHNLYNMTLSFEELINDSIEKSDLQREAL